MMRRDIRPRGTAFGFHRVARTAVILALPAILLSGAAHSEDANAADWPCPQVLVRRISVPAVWSGASIEAVKWRNDPGLAEKVARLAARRTPIEEAQKSIEDIATTAGPAKEAELLALFAGLFETLDAERTQVIDGLVRFGRKQKELAETIRSEQASMRGATSTHGKAPEAEAASARFEWNLRVFEERRQALASVCENPALIEQRLFALARAIEQNLD